MRIVSVGECMLELSPAGGDLHSAAFAGDTFNTAWYLARLRPDWRVDYLSAVGEDGLSRRMLAFMDGAGIGTGGVRTVPGATVGLYMIELRDGERSFTYWRSDSAARRLAEDAGHLARTLEGAALAYLSGITLAILPPEGRRTLLAALAEARRGGTRVAFDPNIRPRLWTDADTMTGTIMEAAAQADIVLPSFEDDAAAFGDGEAEATLARYLAAGASEVVVKDGPNHVVASIAGERFEAMPPQARAVDTTAAGDSFNAGYLAARLAGQAPGDCLAEAAALAARVIGGRGALVPV